MGEFIGTDMYNTGFNTIGMGDVCPPGKPAMSAADFNRNDNIGSGDLFKPVILKKSRKIKKDIIYTNPATFGNGLDYVVYMK